MIQKSTYTRPIIVPIPKLGPNPYKCGLALGSIFWPKTLLFRSPVKAQVKLAQRWPNPEAQIVKSPTEGIRGVYSSGTLGVLCLTLTTIGVVNPIHWAYNALHGAYTSFFFFQKL